MTENNKPIIIDGVNVAGCQYLYFAIEDSIIDCKEHPRCSIGEAFTNDACKNSNCYFKQLDQLKAEKEELKNNNNILKEHSRYYKNEGKRYKSRNGR